MITESVGNTCITNALSTQRTEKALGKMGWACLRQVLPRNVCSKLMAFLKYGFRNVFWLSWSTRDTTIPKSGCLMCTNHVSLANHLGFSSFL